MAFPEGNYSTELEETVGAGFVLSGTTQNITTYTADGDIGYGKCVRFASAEGRIEQGLTIGVAGTSATLSTLTSTGTIGTVAEIKAVDEAGVFIGSDVVSIEFDFTGITETVEVDVRNAAAAIMQAGIRATHTNPKSYDLVTVEYNGTAFVFTMPEGYSFPNVSSFGGVASNDLGLLGLDSVARVAYVAGIPGTIGNFAGIAVREITGLRSAEGGYTEGEEVAVLTGGDIWVENADSTNRAVNGGKLYARGGDEGLFVTIQAANDAEIIGAMIIKAQASDDDLFPVRLIAVKQS